MLHHGEEEPRASRCGLHELELVKQQSGEEYPDSNLGSHKRGRYKGRKAPWSFVEHWMRYTLTVECLN